MAVCVHVPCHPYATCVSPAVEYLGHNVHLEEHEAYTSLSKANYLLMCSNYLLTCNSIFYSLFPTVLDRISYNLLGIFGMPLYSCTSLKCSKDSPYGGG